MKYGRYEVIKEIGRGSMGVVYQAHDPNLDLTVALKVLRQDRVTSSAFLKRFLSEAKALGRLDHPNIIRVYNVDEDKGNVYIAMEFIDGESLNEVIQKTPFSIERIIETGCTVAETLNYAHQQGIVHRDIKPSNILVRSDGRLKITDFGIAHIEDSSSHKQTQAGEILGTPAYMSPEQVLSEKVDGRSDLFSLGVILYELCTGKTPFSGTSLAAIFNAITQVEPPAVIEIKPDIPRDVSDVITKCLKKHPNDRFESGMTLFEALKACIKEEKTAPPIVPDVQKKSPKTFYAFAAVIVSIIIGLTAYYLMKPEKKITPPVQTGTAFLKVESLPAGSEVYIDGTFKGKTPATLQLKTGKHEVRLTAPDHYEWEAQVQLEDKGETPLFVRLIPAAPETSAELPQQYDVEKGAEAPAEAVPGKGTKAVSGVESKGKDAKDELDEMIKDIQFR